MKNLIESGIPNKLNYIGRFDTIPTIHKESVSQHSYWVVFYAGLLYKDLFWLVTLEGRIARWQYYETLGYLNSYAALHDFDEVFTGDVLYQLKYGTTMSEELRAMVHQIAMDKIEAMPKSILRTELLELVKYFATDNVHGPVVTSIVKIADWLSCFQYLLDEYKLGNQNLTEQLINVQQGINIERTKLAMMLEAKKIPYSASAIEKLHQTY